MCKPTDFLRFIINFAATEFTIQDEIHQNINKNQNSLKPLKAT